MNSSDYKDLSRMAWVGSGMNLVVAINHFIGGTIGNYIVGVFHIALAAWLFFFIRRQVRKKHSSQSRAQTDRSIA